MLNPQYVCAKSTSLALKATKASVNVGLFFINWKYNNSNSEREYFLFIFEGEHKIPIYALVQIPQGH